MKGAGVCPRYRVVARLAQRISFVGRSCGSRLRCSRMRTMDHLLCFRSVAGVLFFGMWWTSVAFGQAPSPAPSGFKQKVDLLLSGHVVGVIPQDNGLSVGGSSIPNTDVRGTIGAGIKFDVYPWFT